jgi:hypothetical protein
VLGIGGVLQILTNGGVVGWLSASFLLLGARFLFWPRSRELRLLARCMMALAAVVVLFVAGVFVAMESEEVVLLRYTDDRGRQIEDRLWVIDLEGFPSVTTGSDTRRVALIRSNPAVELVRSGRAECRRATVLTATSATEQERQAAQRLYQEKYGARLHASSALRRFIGGPGSEPVLIRLEPCV